MGDAPDHQRLAVEVLGIRGAPADLARRLVAQALVLEDRREVWRRAGERICRDAPPTPGVYVLTDADGRALYVGKAVHLRRRLRAHFADRRWRALKPGMSRAAGAEWQQVGSEIEALLREAAMIQELLAGRKPQAFKIVTGGKLREYRYWPEGKQQVMTPYGQVEAEVWASQRTGSNRVNKTWHAPSLGYVPVQAVQYRKGNPEVQMKLVKLKRG